MPLSAPRSSDTSLSGDWRQHAERTAALHMRIIKRNEQRRLEARGDVLSEGLRPVFPLPHLPTCQSEWERIAQGWADVYLDTHRRLGGTPAPAALTLSASSIRSRAAHEAAVAFIDTVQEHIRGKLERDVRLGATTPNGDQNGRPIISRVIR